LKNGRWVQRPFCLQKKMAILAHSMVFITVLFHDDFMRKLKDALAPVLIYAAFMTGCAAPPSMPAPTSTSTSVGGPFVFSSSEYTLTDDADLKTYPTVQHFTNAVSGRELNLFLPTGSDVAPGTLLILTCDNTQQDSSYFTIHFERSDTENPRHLLGRKTTIFVSGNNHRWKAFRFE
jgi:hypothetical protein